MTIEAEEEEGGEDELFLLILVLLLPLDDEEDEQLELEDELKLEDELDDLSSSVTWLDISNAYIGDRYTAFDLEDDFLNDEDVEEGLDFAEDNEFERYGFFGVFEVDDDAEALPILLLLLVAVLLIGVLAATLRTHDPNWAMV